MARISPVIKVEDSVKILTYIIGLIGFLSVVRHTGPGYSLTFAFLIAFSLYFEYRKNFLIPRWALNVISISVIVLTFLRVRVDDIITPSTESLLILLAIKFLEDKKFRDFMQIYTISVFLLAGSSLLSMDIIFLVYFTSLIFLLTIATVLLAYYSQDRTIELHGMTALKIALNSVLISVVSIPLTFFMFIILPRTSYPLFDFLNRSAGAAAGFTDNVRLGAVSDIQEDASVALRVSMEKVNENLLYWRGIVLDYFDGVSWKSSGREPGEDKFYVNLPGRRVVQTVYLEPYENRYLFALDKPVSISLQQVKRYGGLTYLQPDIAVKRTKYQAVSSLSGALPEKEIDRDVYLQLPGRKMDRISNLVKNITAGKNEEAAAGAILKYLRSGDYKYSLKNLPVSREPLEEFLFRYKYGNCEYFASAMAVMLRVSGIPSRLVGGYMGGYYNDIGKYYIIPQKNAHVWVEAYMDGRGWIRADPTPAQIGDFISPLKGSVFLKMKIILDTINYYWNASVIGYDIEVQITMLQKIGSGLKKPDIRMSINKDKIIKYSRFLVVIVSVAIILYFTILKRKSHEERIIAAFLKKLEKAGYAKSKSEGLEEFVSGIQDDQQRDRAYKFAREFEGYYYRDKRLVREDFQKLKQLVEDI